MMQVLRDASDVDVRNRYGASLANCLLRVKWTSGVTSETTGCFSCSLWRHITAKAVHSAAPSCRRNLCPTDAWLAVINVEAIEQLLHVNIAAL